MIYDCFSFFNELEVLDIRLHTLDCVVDKFVLVEAPWTHTGKPKPLVFEANKERFAPFLHKIIHIVAEDIPTPPNDCPKLIMAWARENAQRNAILTGLQNLNPDDTVLISDLDEIPDPTGIKKHAKDDGISAFHQLSFRYYINFINMNETRWIGSKMLKWSTFCDKAIYSNMKQRIVMPEFANPIPSITRIRHLSPTQLIIGGWHFSYYGGAKQIKLKMQSIADYACDSATSISLETIERHVLAGKDPLQRGLRFCAIPIGDQFPEYIRNNLTKFQHNIIACKCISIKNKLLFSILPIKKQLVDYVAGHIPECLKPLVYSIYKHIVKNPIPLMKDQLAQK